MFLGVLFLFVDITIPLFGGSLDLIPDVIGWWLIYADMKDLLLNYELGRSADENTSLIGAMMVASLIGTMLNLFIGGIFFGLVAGVLEICNLVFAWMLVGVADTLEQNLQIPCEHKNMRSATLLLTIATPIFLAGSWLIRSGLFQAVLWVVYLAAVIYYLYQVYRWNETIL